MFHRVKVKSRLVPISCLVVLFIWVTSIESRTGSMNGLAADKGYDQVGLQGLNVWTALGSFADTVNAIAIDPVVPTTVYVGVGFQRGVFKSTDLGLTWLGINNGVSTSDGHTATVSALAISRGSPQIVYAGTRENGVFRSTDGGANWFAVNQGLPGRNIRALLVNPSSPSIVCAGVEGSTREGLYRSTDNGATWQVTSIQRDVDVLTFAVHPQAPDRVYAGTDKGVFRSFDGGRSWSLASNGLPARSVLSIRGIAIDPLTPSTIYIGGSTSAGLGIFRSLDAADNWSPMITGLTDLDVTALAVDPNVSNIVYAGTEAGGVFESSDGGSTWRPMNQGLDERFEREVTKLVVSPGMPITLFVGTDKRGLFGFSFTADSEPPIVRDVRLSRKKVKRKVDPNVTITWQSTDNKGVVSHDLDFAEDGEHFVLRLASGLPGNALSFDWTVPSTLPKTAVGIVRVTAHDASGNSGSALSGILRIK